MNIEDIIVNGSLGLLQSLFNAFSGTPHLLLLTLVLIGFGFLVYRMGIALTNLLKKQMETLSAQVESIVKNLKTISEDLNKLSQAFEVHVVKTEFRIDTIEKRIDRLEKIHIKEDP